MKMAEMQEIFSSFLTYSYIWRKRKDEEVALESDFEDNSFLLTRGKIRPVFTICSELLLKHSLALFDTGTLENRSLVGDTTIALLRVLKDKGQDIQKGQRESITHEQLDDILNIKKSHVNVIENFNMIEGVDLLEDMRNRLEFFTKISVIVWWNFEWKIFWHEWEKKEKYPLYFGKMKGEVHSVVYNPLLKNANLLFKTILETLPTMDEQAISDMYNELETVLSMMFNILYGSERQAAQAVHTGEVDPVAIESENFDLCFPLNINIVDFGAKRNLSLFDQEQKSDLLKVCLALNLDTSTFAQWRLREQWYSDYKFAFTQYTEKNSTTATLRTITEFAKEAYNMGEAYCKNQVKTPTGSTIANLILNIQVYSEFTDILRHFKFSSFKSNFIKGIIYAGIFLRKPQIDYFKGDYNSDVKLYMSLLSSQLGYNKWHIIREEVFNIPVNTLELDAKNLLQDLQGEKLTDVITEIKGNTKEFKISACPIFQDTYNSLTGEALSRAESDDIAYTYYKGIVVEFEATWKIGYENYEHQDIKNLDFWKQIPRILSQMQELELFEKTMNVNQNDIQIAVERTTAIWIKLL